MDPVALRPLGVGEILDVAIRIYRAHFKTLVKTVAVVVGPVAVLSVIIQISAGTSTTGTTTSFTRPGQPDVIDTKELWAFAAGTLIVSLLSFVATELAVGSSFKAISEGYLGGQPEWRPSIRFAFSKLRSMLWVAFLVAFLAGFALLACIVPGVYLWGCWAVAVPIVLFEDAKGRKALKRSRSLVRGRWWPTAGAVLLASLLAGIVQSALTGIVIGVAASGAGDVARALANGVAQVVGLSLVTPFSAGVSTVVYYDLRVRKEGFDIELLAQRIGVDPVGFERPALFPAAPPPVTPDDQPPFWPPPPGWRPGGGSTPPADG